MESNIKAGKYITVASFAWASHFVSLWGNFVFDDSEAIVKNKDVMLHTSWTSVFQNDFWGTNMALNRSHKSYRPLTILSYRLNVFFSNNRLDAFQFHTANVVLHGILSIMALPLFECLLKRKKHRKTLSPRDDPAFTGALLFATHPVHCEAVAALVGRADILAALLFFLLIILQSKIHRNLTVWFLMVFFISGAAVLCKENAITVLAVCLVTEIYNRKNSSKPWRVLWEKTAIKVILLCLIGLCIMYFRLKIMNFEGPTFSHMDNPAAFAESLLTRFLSHSYIYFLNVLLLIWPYWLSFDWSMGCIPLLNSLWDYRFLCVFIFWTLCLYIILVSLRRVAETDKIDVASVGISLGVLTFLPASNLLFRVGFVIAERNLLLPSAGFCLLVAVGLEKLKERYGNCKFVLNACYVLLVAVFVARCIQRNYEWLNEERLFVSALKVCPLNAKVHYNIAKVAADRSQRAKAVRSYRDALVLYPDYEQAMNNLANLLREDGLLDEAETLLRRAVQVRPNFAAAWMNLGIVLSGKGFLVEAENAYRTAIRYRTPYADAHYNLGNLLLDMERNEEALAEWKEACRQRPGHRAAWGNALALLDGEGRASEAVELGRQALRHVPRAPAVYFAMGNALGKLKRFTEAEAHFLQAIRLNDKNALYYSNLGVLYHRWDKPEKAREMYHKALKINPDLKSALTNLRKLEVVNNNVHSNNSNSL